MAAEGEEGDIDLFNDETFGDGAVGERYNSVKKYSSVCVCVCVCVCVYVYVTCYIGMYLLKHILVIH